MKIVNENISNFAAAKCRVRAAAPNLKTANMIMCCLLRVITYLRGHSL
jgi:hypothetical protein